MHEAHNEFRVRLAQLTFEERLGSVAERANRIGVIARAAPPASAVR